MITIPRIARKDLKTPFLHVMVQGVNKEYIFYKKEYIEKYLKIIKENKKRYQLTILAYCIMNNHAHFLIYVKDINQLGQFMQKINLLYSVAYNREEKRCGVLFRNRYQTEPIYNEKYLINCIKYIHNNPVKAKMVSKCEDYPYSSYNDYLKNEGVTQSEIMTYLFGKNPNYTELFKQTFERRYIDINGTEEFNKEYFMEGIREFKKTYKENTVNIMSSRKVLKKLIAFLYDICKFKYNEISYFWEIPRGTMESLKK